MNIKRTVYNLSFIALVLSFTQNAFSATIDCYSDNTDLETRFLNNSACEHENFASGDFLGDEFHINDSNFFGESTWELIASIDNDASIIYSTSDNRWDLQSLFGVNPWSSYDNTIISLTFGDRTFADHLVLVSYQLIFDEISGSWHFESVDYGYGYIDIFTAESLVKISLFGTNSMAGGAVPDPNGSPSTTVTEPTTLALLGFGLIVLTYLRRRIY